MTASNKQRNRFYFLSTSAAFISLVGAASSQESAPIDEETPSEIADEMEAASVEVEATEEEPPPSFSDRIASWNEKLNGKFELDYFGYFQDSPIDPVDHFVGSSLYLDFSGYAFDDFYYFVRPRFQLDNASRASDLFDVIETSEDRYYFNFDEAYVDYSSSKYRITAGKQVYSWGVSDTYKPVENLNPFDLVDLPTGRKMGVYSLGATGFWDKFTLDTVFVPWFTPSRLPKNDNRWSGSNQAQISQLSSLLGYTPIVSPGGRDLPSSTLDNVQGGARLASSSLIPGWDLGLTFIQGIDPIGALEANLGAPPVVGLRQVFQKFREYGGTVSTTYGSAEFHTEVAYRDTVDNAYDDDFVEYVGGVNYTFYNFPLVEQMRLVAEYAGESVVSSKETNNFIVDTGQYIRPFKSSFLGSAEFKFTEETQFTLSSAYNFNGQDYYLQPKLSHKFYSGLQLEAGVDIMEGSPDSFFGRWDRSDRFFLISTYAF